MSNIFMIELPLEQETFYANVSIRQQPSRQFHIKFLLHRKNTFALPDEVVLEQNQQEMRVLLPESLSPEITIPLIAAITSRIRCVDA